MAHVDKVLLDIYSMSKDKEVIDNYRRVIPFVFCSFNLDSESVLSVIEKVDWKACVKYVLDNMNDIESISANLESFWVFKNKTGQRGSIDQNGLTIVHKGMNFINLPKWLFMYSVFGNILKNKGILPSSNLNLAIFNIMIDIPTYDKWKDKKIPHAEIPQLTMSEESKTKEICELSVDDFEIWNYVYD